MVGLFVLYIDLSFINGIGLVDVNVFFFVIVICNVGICVLSLVMNVVILILIFFVGNLVVYGVFCIFVVMVD